MSSDYNLQATLSREIDEIRSRCLSVWHRPFQFRCLLSALACSPSPPIHPCACVWLQLGLLVYAKTQAGQPCAGGEVSAAVSHVLQIFTSQSMSSPFNVFPSSPLCWGWCWA